jgi:RNA polymerase sigma-70 factor, ECF subfamily
MSEGSTFEFAETVCREDNSMQNTDAYVGTEERLEIPGRERTTQALEQILSSGLRFFHREAYQVLGNVADAEDAVQDALLAAYTHLDQFRGQSKMTTWLVAIVHNAARMHLRKRLRHVHVPLDEPIGEVQTLSVSEQLADCRPTPEDECRDSELSTRLTHFHSRLSPTLRRTFQLRDVDGLSIRETAQILGVPRGTVKAQSARARKKLEQWMRSALRPRSRSLRDRLPASGIFRRRRDGSILQHAHSEK